MVATRRVSHEDSPEVLATLPHRQFYNLVDADIRRKLDSRIAEKLRHPAVAERWYITLVQMKKSAEGVIAAKSVELKVARLHIERAMEDADEARSVVLRKEERDLTVEFEEWRLKTIRFKTGVEEMMGEAQWARTQAALGLLQVAAIEERTLAVQQLFAASERIKQLEAAVRLHKQEIESEPDNITDADEDLWTVVDADAPLPYDSDGTLSSTIQAFRHHIGAPPRG